MMLAEHENHLVEIDKLTSLMEKTQNSVIRNEMERFLQNVSNHIYIENNLLFPQAIRLEKSLS